MTTDKLTLATEALRNAMNLAGEEAFAQLTLSAGSDDCHIIFWPRATSREILHRVRRALGLRKIEKRHYDGGETHEMHETWSGQTVYGHAQIDIEGMCKIVGYKEVALPAQEARTVQKPIWNCGD